MTFQNDNGSTSGTEIRGKQNNENVNLVDNKLVKLMSAFKFFY
jgi:hypothetical protein